MFIKKDLRKLSEILADPKDTREEMKLARRVAEFGGSTHVLCDSSNLPALTRLRYLSLYSNKLDRLTKIGNLAACAELEEINLGRNVISRVPSEVRTVRLCCVCCCCSGREPPSLNQSWDHADDTAPLHPARPPCDARNSCAPSSSRR